MPFFKYQIINKEYDKEVGQIEAIDETRVAELLSERAIQIISISKTVSYAQLENSFYAMFLRVKARDLVLFFRQFAVLISASINLSESLKILSDQTENRLFKKVIGNISKEVDSGDRLSDAMAKHQEIFSEFHMSVIRSGESSGKLDESLGYLADEEERNYEIMKKVRGAMTYPILVIGAMIIVGVLMMLFVIPKLIAVFNEVGGELPLMTRLLIWVSNLFVNYWWLLLALAVGFVFVLRFYLKLPFGKRQFDYLVLRAPIAGDLIRKLSIVRFARSLSTLLVGGVNISNSLKIAKGIVGNTLFKDLINQTIIEVEKGNSISSVFMNSAAVPVMVPRMIVVGEKTGKLDFILTKIAEFYSKELENKLDNLMILLEPLIMIFMGVAVGIMAAAIILPMYNLTTQF